MTKVFITGATGFIGSHVCCQLVSKGYEVHALKRRSSTIPQRLKDLSIQWYEGDILDVLSLQAAMKDCEIVYHCAGFVSLSNFQKKEMYQVNIEGTAHVVNVALEQGIKKLGYISSVAALNTLQENLDEYADFHAEQRTDAYGLSKYYGEMEVWRGVAEGLPSIVINPSIVLADDDWTEGSGRFFHRVKKGLRYYPLGSTGFVDVTDVASCFIRLMESEVANEKFIINSENLTYFDFLSHIAHAFGKSKPRKKLYPWMLSLFWRISALASLFTRTEPLISRFSAGAASRLHHYSNKKIKDTIAYEFMPIATSIERQIYLKDGNLPRPPLQ